MSGGNYCPDCKGEGVIAIGWGDDPHYREYTCDRCGGTGRLSGSASKDSNYYSTREVCPDCKGAGVIAFGWGDDPHYKEHKCQRCIGKGVL